MLWLWLSKSGLDIWGRLGSVLTNSCRKIAYLNQLILLSKVCIVIFFFMFQQNFSDRSASTAKDRVEHSHIQYVGILQYHLSIQCCLWQYGLLSFKVRGTKWDIFLPKHSNFCCEIGFKGQVPRILERWSLVSDQICVKKIKKNLICFYFDY